MDPHSWMLFGRENTNLRWVMIWGYPYFRRPKTFVDAENHQHHSPFPPARLPGDVVSGLMQWSRHSAAAGGGKARERRSCGFSGRTPGFSSSSISIKEGCIWALLLGDIPNVEVPKAVEKWLTTILMDFHSVIWFFFFFSTETQPIATAPPWSKFPNWVRSSFSILTWLNQHS